MTGRSRSKRLRQPSKGPKQKGARKGGKTLTRAKKIRRYHSTLEEVGEMWYNFFGHVEVQGCVS